MGKSELVLVGVVPDMDLLVDILGCKQASFPMKYLGLPLDEKFKDSSIWNPIIEVERKLSSWKRLYLSKGGKVTLIKSTLSNLPIYFVSLFPILVDVANCLEQLQRNFIWNGMEDDLKIHLVNLSMVCSPIQFGGLGIRNLRCFNEFLLGKWLWRFGTGGETFWRRVIGVKHESEGGAWCSKSVPSPYGVNLWKSIRRGWPNFSRYV